jgi:hypothetical protein
MNSDRLTLRVTIMAALIIAMGTAACSFAPYRYQNVEDLQVTERAEVKEQGAFRIRASVPSQAEAEQIFGFPIYKRGIQPVWLEVTNFADQRGRLILSSIDREYFAPLEVAYMHKKRFSTEGWKDMEKYLYRNALPRHIPPQQTVSGFVFTHASKGTKAFNVDVFYSGTRSDPEWETFTFFIEVPGFVPDHASVDFAGLYTAAEVKEVNQSSLRELLADIPCCTTNRDGTKEGRPVQVFFVAAGRDMLQALLRAGWNETSYVRDEQYLEGADYLFGRPADAVFRKGRDESTERVEISMWMAPVLVDGKPLWVSRFKHAIGRRYQIGELFFGVQLDPDTSDGRNFLIQDMWYGQAVRHWAWSMTGVAVPKESPRYDFHGNAWFSNDEVRPVIWISGEPVALGDAEYIDWGRRAVEHAEALQ